MQVSAKVDYGIRALVVLASNFDAENPKLVKGDFIAKQQGIPIKFLEGILTDLRHNGFVVSQRGAEGGYRLSRDPDKIVLADVLRVLDGPLAAVRGIRPEDVVYDAPAAGLAQVWLAMRVALRRVLETVTLAQVLSGEFAPQVQALLNDPDANVSRALYSSK
jgi:Rrf2 family protein